MNPKPAKAPFDFGLDFFSSVPPTSSTPDTTMTSLNSTMLASPGVMLGGGVEHKKQMSDTISLDSFGDDSGMRPGDWQYVSSLSLSLSPPKPPHTPTPIPTDARPEDAEMQYPVDVTEVVSIVSFVVRKIRILTVRMRFCDPQRT